MNTTPENSMSRPKGCPFLFSKNRPQVANHWRLPQGEILGRDKIDMDKFGRAGRKLLCGGGMARKPICPTNPSPSLVAVPGGGFGLGLPSLPCRGGGGGPTPTYMAQNDPHVALIILTTHTWGKNFE